MLRDFCVNFTVLKIKSKKLKRKVKYAVLACILQDDFESLVMKLRLLEFFFFPDASLRVIDIKRKKNRISLGCPSHARREVGESQGVV